MLIPKNKLFSRDEAVSKLGMSPFDVQSAVDYLEAVYDVTESNIFIAICEYNYVFVVVDADVDGANWVNIATYGVHAGKLVKSSGNVCESVIRLGYGLYEVK